MRSRKHVDLLMQEEEEHEKVKKSELYDQRWEINSNAKNMSSLLAAEVLTIHTNSVFGILTEICRTTFMSHGHTKTLKTWTHQDLNVGFLQHYQVITVKLMQSGNLVEEEGNR